MSNVRVRHYCPEGIGIDKPSLGQKMRIKPVSYTHLGYEEWATEVQSPAVRSILNQPKKIYSARIQHKSNTYDIAAAARTDADGIVFCAVRQNEEKLDHYYEPVRNLLARNETRLKGTLYIAEGERILASNKNSAECRTTAEVTELQALARSQAGNVPVSYTHLMSRSFTATAMQRGNRHRITPRCMTS